MGPGCDGPMCETWSNSRSTTLFTLRNSSSCTWAASSLLLLLNMTGQKMWVPWCHRFLKESWILLFMEHPGHLGTDDVVWLGFEFLWLGNHIRQPAGVSVILTWLWILDTAWNTFCTAYLQVKQVHKANQQWEQSKNHFLNEAEGKNEFCSYIPPLIDFYFFSLSLSAPFSEQRVHQLKAALCIPWLMRVENKFGAHLVYPKYGEMTVSTQVSH